MTDFTGGAWRSLVDGQEIVDIPVLADFESGDLSNWSNTSNFGVQQDVVFEGQYAVEHTSQSNFSVMTYDDPNGDVTGRGQTIQYRCYVPSGVSAYGSHAFGIENSGSDYYTVRIDGSGSSGVRKVSSGSASEVTDLGSIPVDEWLRVVRRWFDGSEDGRNQGDMEIEVFDSSGNSVLTLTGNDTEYTSSVIGLDATFSGSWVVDNIVAGETTDK